VVSRLPDFQHHQLKPTVGMRAPPGRSESGGQGEATAPGEVCPTSFSSFGPTWQMAYFGECAPSYFMSPGEYSSLGPCTGWVRHTERPGRGFGIALNINSGVPDSGEDHIRMYVR
jgi:hypothetical protein